MTNTWWKDRRIQVLMAGTAGVVGLFVLVATSAIILREQSTSVWARRFVRVIPVPAANVEGRFVLYRDLLPHWDAIDSYLKNVPIQNNQGQLLASRQELRQEAYEQLIRQRVIVRHAKEVDFIFDESAVEANMQALLVAPDGTTSTREQVAAMIEAEIGWTIDQYRDWLVRPAVFEQGVRETIWATSTQEEWDARVDSWTKTEGVRRFLKFSPINP